MLQFYRCNVCGNLVEVIESSGVNPVCCGKKMELLVPGTTDGAKEKHIPAYLETVAPADSAGKLKEIVVQIGELPHPMMPEHYIPWITVLTDHGIYRKHLSSSQEPCAKFLLQRDENILAIYAYCNLHGLWVNT